jgi:hypothetical protein
LATAKTSATDYFTSMSDAVAFERAAFLLREIGEALRSNWRAQRISCPRSAVSVFWSCSTVKVVLLPTAYFFCSASSAASA